MFRIIYRVRSGEQAPVFAILRRAQESKLRGYSTNSSGHAYIFLTIFSAGSFSGVFVDTTISTELQVADVVWYGTSGPSGPSGFALRAVASSLTTAVLILDSNLTHPSFTYEDLILPNMTVDHDFIAKYNNSSDIQFSVALPAAHPSVTSCRLYNSSQVRVDFTSWLENGAPVFVEPENCFENRLADLWNLRIAVTSRNFDTYTRDNPWLRIASSLCSLLESVDRLRDCILRAVAIDSGSGASRHQSWEMRYSRESYLFLLSDVTKAWKLWMFRRVR